MITVADPLSRPGGPADATPAPAPAGPDRWTPRQRAMLAELGLAAWAPAVADVLPLPVNPGARASRPAGVAATAPAARPDRTDAADRTDRPSPTLARAAPADATARRREADAPPAEVPSRRPDVDPRPAGASRSAAAAADAAPSPARRHEAVVAGSAGAEAVRTGVAPRSAGVATMGWDDLAATVADCRACRLCEGRTRTVFGTGPREAHWLVVGEAPGEQEDLQGEPFVGKSGQLLDAMLRALGLSRAAGTPPAQAVYIANTVKCRPPGNRNPQPDELATCEPYLMRQIALLKPRMILAMGRFAVQSLLRTDEPVGRLRGRVHRYEGVPLVVTYHPAYLLRSPAEKARAWDDLCRARAALGDDAR